MSNAAVRLPCVYCTCSFDDPNKTWELGHDEPGHGGMKTGTNFDLILAMQLRVGMPETFGNSNQSGTANRVAKQRQDCAETDQSTRLQSCQSPFPVTSKIQLTRVDYRISDRSEEVRTYLGPIGKGCFFTARSFSCEPGTV
jgi:hypothetical protein